MSLRRRRIIGPSFPHLSTPYGGVASVGGYDADTTAWISAVVSAGGTVSDAQKGRVDDLIVGLKAASLWTKCDSLWLWAGEAVSAQATKDIKSLRTLTVPVGTETLTWRGYNSSAGDGVLNSTIVPSAGGFQYTQNSASVGIYVAARSGDTASDFSYNVGADSATGTSLYIRVSPASLQFASSVVNDGTSHSGALSLIDSLWIKDGFYVASRTSSSTRAMYYDGSQLGSSFTETSVDVPISSIVFSGRNQAGAYTPEDQDHYCVGWIGGGLTSGEVTSLNTLIKAYLAYYNIAPNLNTIGKTQEFTSADWTIGANLSRSSDVSIAPDGTTTADKLWCVNATSDERLSQTILRVGATANTFSVYLKPAGSWTWASVRVYGPVDSQAWFNLAAGTKGAVSGSGVTSDMVSASNGFYRCSVSTPSSPTTCMIYVVDANSSFNITPSGTDGIYMWGAQCNPGMTAQPYNRMP